MPFTLLSTILLVSQLLLLACLALLTGSLLTPPVSLAGAGLLYLLESRQFQHTPRPLPDDSRDRSEMARLRRNARNLARRAGLQQSPRPQLIIGPPNIYVVRTRPARLCVSLSVLWACRRGELARSALDALVAHEIAHLRERWTLAGDVLALAVRLAVLGLLLGLLVGLWSGLSLNNLALALLMGGLGLVALLLNGSLLGGWSRLRELRADRDRAALLGPAGATRLAAALRAWSRLENRGTFTWLLLLKSPALRARRRGKLHGDIASLGAEGEELRGLASDIDALADRHRSRFWERLGRLALLAGRICRGSTAVHPTLGVRLHRLQQAVPSGPVAGRAAS